MMGLAALLGGCGSIAGEVRDAATGKPVAGAVVKVSTTGWGRRDGQLVWDAETVHEARTGRDGHFRFSGIDGGGRLQVQSAVGQFDHGSLCPRSQLVWVGGPNAELQTNRRLVFADALEPDDEDRTAPPALAGTLGLSGHFADDNSRGRITGKGVSFVRGTGAIPPAPPLPYAQAVDVDFGADCGWIFVSDGVKPVAVIEARSPSGRQNPGEEWRWSMLFAMLPDAR